MVDRQNPTKAPCKKCKKKMVKQTMWGNAPTASIDPNMDPQGTQNMDSRFKDRMRHIAKNSPKFDGVRDRLKERFG